MKFPQFGGHVGLLLDSDGSDPLESGWNPDPEALLFGNDSRALHADGLYQGVTKRCRLSWLAISALIYESKYGGGGGGIAGSQAMSTAVHMEPK